MLNEIERRGHVLAQKNLFRESWLAVVQPPRSMIKSRKFVGCKVIFFYIIYIFGLLVPSIWD